MRIEDHKLQLGFDTAQLQAILVYFRHILGPRLGRDDCWCPLLAQSRYRPVHRTCPLSRV